jgi:hypothetical protein
MVGAVGLVAWAINGYKFKRDRKKMVAVISATWNVPAKAAEALLSAQVPYTIEDEAVCFEFVT